MVVALVSGMQFICHLFANANITYNHFVKSTGNLITCHTPAQNKSLNGSCTLVQSFNKRM